MNPSLTQLLQPLLGILVILALAWILSEQRRAVRPRLVVAGLALQFGLALLLLEVAWVRAAFAGLTVAVQALQEATDAGTALVFGYLGAGAAPFEVIDPGQSFILAFRALPLILVISALSALLFHWRILPPLVRAFAWLLRRTLGTGGPLGMGAAANVFVGMTEAPLLIRPYLASLSRPALFALMTCGMATVAGTVMVIYANLLSPTLPDAMGHILTASLISAPAALMLAGILIPEPSATGQRQEDALPPLERTSQTSLDALTRGALEAIPLWLNIIAMLIVMIALVGLVNMMLGALPPVAGEPLTAQRLLGWAMAPFMWLIGIPWAEAPAAGALMGIKTILNEFVAYLALAATPEESLSERSRLILTYALCGFANLGSLGIMIGGLGALVPERRAEIAALGLRSVLAGTLATLMTGAVVAAIHWR